ncbi:hypothetical protein FHS59_002642 [Algoriphagus iocasae]|uniref:Uncharacterized protein n=1 Tax=Algoriphagus iocasae TaxID=1836499 RepID=A0A841MQN9_9BACT|nr:hypothetical protein [Algoriphagus iocasae]
MMGFFYSLNPFYSSVGYLIYNISLHLFHFYGRQVCEIEFRQGLNLLAKRMKHRFL